VTGRGTLEKRSNPAYKPPRRTARKRGEPDLLSAPAPAAG